MNDSPQMDTSLLNNNGQTSNLELTHVSDNMFSNNIIDSFLSPPPLINSKDYEGNHSHSIFFPSQSTKFSATSENSTNILQNLDQTMEINEQLHSQDINVSQESVDNFNIVSTISSLMPHLENNIDHHLIFKNDMENITDTVTNINIPTENIDNKMEILSDHLISNNEVNFDSQDTHNTNMDSQNGATQQNGLGVYECIICKNVKSCQYQIPKQPSLDNSIINSDVYICDKQCLTVFINKNLLEVIGQENVETDSQQNSIINDTNKINGENTTIQEPPTAHDKQNNFKKLCIFCYAIMPEFLSHLYITDDSSKPICPKHLPCQAVQFSIPSCVECGKRLVAGRMVLLDSNLDFCSEHCLSVFLPKLSINCYLCKKILTKEAFGQYCLKLENRNIRQFCGEHCLENFNPLATYCCFCHKDITSMSNPTVSNTDLFCTKNCLQLHEKLVNAQKLQKETGQCPCDICSVCELNQPIQQMLVLAQAPGSTALVKICSEACLRSFTQTLQTGSGFGVSGASSVSVPTPKKLAPAQNACEQCQVSMAGRKSMSALTVDGRTHFFCSQACTERFKESGGSRSSGSSGAAPPTAQGSKSGGGDNALSHCQWCHVTRYVRDMVAVILDDEDDGDTSKGNRKKIKGENKKGKEAEIKYFCSQNCVSLFKMNEDSEVEGNKVTCANCGKDEHSQYSMYDPSKNESVNFCSLPCITMYKKHMAKAELKRKTTGPKRATGSGNVSYTNKSTPTQDDLSGIKETIKKMASISKSPDSFKVLLDILRSVGGQAQDKGTSTVWPVPPRDLKNKSTSIKPLVRSQGTSCLPINAADKETQTETEPAKIIPIPIPVPFYVPFPLHMYTSYTPVPMALPVPIPVPTFIPTTYNTGDEISKYIKSIKDKVPSDPLQAELLMIAQMVADNDEINPDLPVPPDPVHLKPLKGTPGFKPPPDAPFDSSTGSLGHNATSMSGPTLTASGDEVYQIQFDGDFNASNLGNFGGDVTTAIPIQNADGSITYATIDPQTGTLTPIDPLILQQHLQSLHLQQQQQQQQNQLMQNQQLNNGGDPSNAQLGEGGAMSQEEQQKQLLQALIDPNTGELLSQHQQQQASSQLLAQHNLSSRGMIPDFSPPYTFTLEPHQKHMESTYGVGAYKWWVRMRNGELALSAGPYWKDDPLQLTIEELVLSLAMFVKEIKKPNEENYTSDSIYYFCLGIQSSLFENGRSENVFTDTLYGTFTDSLNEVLLRFEPQITTEGMLLSRIDEECLWESMQLGAHSPHVLLNTLLYFNTKYFHLTTLEAHLSLSFKHVQKVTKTLEDGKLATVLRFYPPGEKSVEEQIQEGVAVYEQAENVDNPLRCPVRLYEFYLSKCPDSTREREDVFYLLPESLCLPNSPMWYSEEPLSPTILAKMFNRIFIVKETLESNIAL